MKRTNNSAASERTTVIEAIITEDHIAALEPAVPMLESMLKYTRRTFIAGGPQGYQEREETVWFCSFDIKDRLCFPAGLLPRVRQVLREHGYRLQIEDRRTPGPRLTVDESAIKGAEAKLKPFLKAIIHQPLGQIEVANANDALGGMLLIGEVFPDARVVVAVATRRQAWRLWKRLNKFLRRSVALALSGVKKSAKSWLVSTFGSVPRSKAGEYDILLLPNAEEAIGNRACEIIPDLDFKRIYAFIRPQRRSDSLVKIRLELMAGSVIHCIKKPRVPIHVLMVPTATAGNVASAATALERKRALYWHHDVRNDFIAVMAKALLSGDRLVLKKGGLRNKDMRALKKSDKHKIMVLVETPEHGRELLARLPGWNMLTLEPGNTATTNSESMVKPTPAVVTAAYAAKHLIRADIVLRATGTGWRLRLKGFPPKRSKHGPDELLVIDFDDNFHTDAKEDTRQRVQEYQRQGMQVATRNREYQGITERNSSEERNSLSKVGLD